MWNAVIILSLFLFSLLQSCVCVAETSGLDFGIDLTESYFIKENYLLRNGLERVDDLHFTKEYSYNLVNMHPSVTFAADKGVQGYLGADISWQNPVEEDGDDEVTADLSTAYLSFRGDPLSVDLGLQPIQFGNGLIMADDALAATTYVSLGDGYAELKAAQVMDSSPMVGLTLGYHPGAFERLEIFGIWYRDRDDTFAYSLPLVYQVLLDLSSEGRLNFYGAAADLFVGDTLLSLVGAYQTGHYTVTYRTLGGQSGEIHPDVNAYFGDISLRHNLTDWCTAELFCFVSSGDARPSDRELKAFISITPYNSRAAIFFDPDFMGLNDSQRLTYSGGFAGGVIAPGLNLSLAFGSRFDAEAALIYMFADQALDDGRRWYGWEVDLSVSYSFGQYYKLFLEAARFEHGDYFEALLDEETEPVIRLAVGLRTIF